MLTSVLLLTYMFLSTWQIGQCHKIMSRSSLGIKEIKGFLNYHLQYIYCCIFFWSALLFNNFFLLYTVTYQIKNPRESVVSANEIEGIIKLLRRGETVYQICLFFLLI
jgi:hypothetical protein